MELLAKFEADSHKLDRVTAERNRCACVCVCVCACVCVRACLCASVSACVCLSVSFHAIGQENTSSQRASMARHEQDTVILTGY